MNKDFYIDIFTKFVEKTKSGLGEDKKQSLHEVELKRVHTFFVADNCEKIAIWLNFGENEVRLSYLAGLYHDLGRFLQAKRFNTMSDKITGSHALLSLEAIEELNLKNIIGSEKEYNAIYTAIKHHSDFKVPFIEDYFTNVLTHILRDADKLDIFRFITRKDDSVGFVSIEQKERGSFDPVLMDMVEERQNLDISLIKNRCDNILFEVSLIFNLNYGYSMKEVLEKDYPRILLEKYIPDNLKLQKVYDSTLSFLEENLGKRSP